MVASSSAVRHRGGGNSPSSPNKDSSVAININQPTSDIGNNGASSLNNNGGSEHSHGKLHGGTGRFRHNRSGDERTKNKNIFVFGGALSVLVVCLIGMWATTTSIKSSSTNRGGGGGVRSHYPHHSSPRQIDTQSRKSTSNNNKDKYVVQQKYRTNNNGDNGKIIKQQQQQHRPRNTGYRTEKEKRFPIPNIKTLDIDEKVLINGKPHEVAHQAKDQDHINQAATEEAETHEKKKVHVDEEPKEQVQIEDVHVEDTSKEQETPPVEVNARVEDDRVKEESKESADSESEQEQASEEEKPITHSDEEKEADESEEESGEEKEVVESEEASDDEEEEESDEDSAEKQREKEHHAATNEDTSALEKEVNRPVQAVEVGGGFSSKYQPRMLQLDFESYFPSRNRQSETGRKDKLELNHNNVVLRKVQKLLHKSYEPEDINSEDSRYVTIYPDDEDYNKRLHKISTNSKKYAREAREPIETDSCKARHDWQIGAFPNCNILHEYELGALSSMFGRAMRKRLRKSEGDGSELVKHFANGYWRDVWLLSKNSGSFETQYDKESDFDEEITVLKTLRYRHDFTDRNYDRHRKDALASERLSGSPNVIDIFAYCSNSAVFEYGKGGDIDGKLWPYDEEAGKYYVAEIPSLEKIDIAYQVARAIADMHDVEDDHIASIGE